jgi:hypothetical protein
MWSSFPRQGRHSQDHSKMLKDETLSMKLTLKTLWEILSKITPEKIFP